MGEEVEVRGEEGEGCGRKKEEKEGTGRGIPSEGEQSAHNNNNDEVCCFANFRASGTRRRACACMCCDGDLDTAKKLFARLSFDPPSLLSLIRSVSSKALIAEEHTLSTRAVNCFATPPPSLKPCTPLGSCQPLSVVTDQTTHWVC